MTIEPLSATVRPNDAVECTMSGIPFANCAIDPQDSCFLPYHTQITGTPQSLLQDHTLPSELTIVTSPNNLLLYEHENIFFGIKQELQSPGCQSSLSEGGLNSPSHVFDDLEEGTISLNDIESLCREAGGCRDNSSYWAETGSLQPSKFWADKDVFQVEHRDLLKGPTLAALNSDNTTLPLMDDIDIDLKLTEVTSLLSSSSSSSSTSCEEISRASCGSCNEQVLVPTCECRFNAENRSPKFTMGSMGRYTTCTMTRESIHRSSQDAAAGNNGVGAEGRGGRIEGDGGGGGGDLKTQAKDSYTRFSFTEVRPSGGVQLVGAARPAIDSSHRCGSHSDTEDNNYNSRGVVSATASATTTTTSKPASHMASGPGLQELLSMGDSASLTSPGACGPDTDTFTGVRQQQELQSTQITAGTVPRRGIKRECPAAEQDATCENPHSVDKKWEEIKEYIHSEKRSATLSSCPPSEPPSGRSEPPAMVIATSPSKRIKCEPEDVAYEPHEDDDVKADLMEGDRSDDDERDDDDDDNDDDDDFSDADSDASCTSFAEEFIGASKKEKRYFWQYNIQSKGPKGKRLAKAVDTRDPHVLDDFEDPVFDPELNEMRYKHNGKARRGDGNDVTPNPYKLFQLGNELKKLNRKIHSITTSELTSNTRTKTRREKNKFASRACRLKKKAQHEANKLKTFGLEKEHFQLMQVLGNIKNQIRKRLNNPASDDGEPLAVKLDNLIKSNLTAMIAGNTSDYVSCVLEKIANGDRTGGLILHRD